MDSAQQQQLQQAMHIWAAMIPLMIGFWLIKMALYIIPMWRIAKRAGMNPAITLLAAIPFVGRMITLYVLGFSDWPAMPPVMYPPVYPPQTFSPPYPPQTPPAPPADSVYPPPAQ